MGQPDGTAARAEAGGARGRRGRQGLRLGYGGHLRRAVLPPVVRGPGGGERRRLPGDRRAGPPHAAPHGHRGRAGRHLRPGCGADGAGDTHQPRLAGDAGQSDHAIDRHRGRGRARPRRWRRGRRRLDLRHPGGHPATRARGGLRGPFAHQVHRWPRRRSRRRRAGERRPDGRPRPGGDRPLRRGDLPVQRLAGDARRRHAPAQDGRPRGGGARRRRGARTSPGGPAGDVPRVAAPIPSTTWPDGRWRASRGCSPSRWRTARRWPGG